MEQSTPYTNLFMSYSFKVRLMSHFGLVYVKNIIFKFLQI